MSGHLLVRKEVDRETVALIKTCDDYWTKDLTIPPDLAKSPEMLGSLIRMLVHRGRVLRKPENLLSLCEGVPFLILTHTQSLTQIDLKTVLEWVKTPVIYDTLSKEYTIDYPGTLYRIESYSSYSPLLDKDQQLVIINFTPVGLNRYKLERKVYYRATIF